MKRILAVLTAVILAVSAAGCARFSSGGGDRSDSDTNEASIEYVSPSELSPERVSFTPPDASNAVLIELNGDGAVISGSGASSEGSVVTISQAGVYRVTGSLADGRIIVDAEKQEVAVILDGASVTCSYGSPIYIYKSEKTIIMLADGTENQLADGQSYTFADKLSSRADDEPNACLYSKSDLVIAGAGSLTVSANYNNGITGKDALYIAGCSLTVNAKDHGINGKDKNVIDGANVTVVSGGDGIRSTNDSSASLGRVSIADSVISVTSGGDGVYAVSGLVISGGSFDIVSGGGSKASSTDSSAKGLKAEGSVLIESGGFSLDCLDDAVHANGSILVKGGEFSIASGDDAFHADESLTFEGGAVSVSSCYEGYESQKVTVAGGTHVINASDDGINAGGGADSSSGFRGGEFANNENCLITVSGGDIRIFSSGDGVDSNGSIEMTGGSLYVYSSGQADGALDYNGSMTVTGGALLAMTGGGMPEAPSSASQPVLVMGFGQNVPEGTVVTLAGSSFSFDIEVMSSNHVVFSGPELVSGETVTVSYSGTELGSAELTVGVVTVGTVNGGFGPGQGGFGPGQGGFGPGQGGFDPGQGGFGPGQGGFGPGQGGFGPGGQNPGRP